MLYLIFSFLFISTMGCGSDPVACLMDGEEGCQGCFPADNENKACPDDTTELDASCDENGYTQEEVIEGTTIYLDPDNFLGWDECMAEDQ